jgi:hypothetical protein
MSINVVDMTVHVKLHVPGKTDLRFSCTCTELRDDLSKDLFINIGSQENTSRPGAHILALLFANAMAEACPK